MGAALLLVGVCRWLSLVVKIVWAAGRIRVNADVLGGSLPPFRRA